MLGAVLEAVGEPVTIEKLEPLPPGPHDVVVRVEASGLCHTDLHLVDGHVPIALPIVLGHEGAGVVEQVGDGVVGIVPGDTVIACAVAACGRCYWCAHNQPTLCSVKHLEARARRSDGQEIRPFVGLGSFASQMTINADATVVVRTDLPMEQLALLGCGVLTGVCAVLNAAAVRAGETVAVVGCGGVGLSAVQAARLAGATQVIAVDVVADKLDWARRLGATDVVDASTADVVAHLRDLTEGRGPDAVIDFVGRPDTIVAGWRAARKGGRAVVVGSPSPEAMIAIPAAEFLVGAKSLTGCVLGFAELRRDIPRLVRWAERGDIDLATLITSTLPLTQLDEALDDLRRGRGLRAVVTAF
jgi:S-(hydroxymethyl)glutathione dehydrogenase/alcohol dehydrogenase